MSSELPTEPAQAPGLRTVEQWCKHLRTPAWAFAGARVANHWPIGRELTEADYVAAIDRACNVVCR